MSDAVAARRRRASFPLLYVVGARTLFASDDEWLAALEHVAAAVAPWLESEQRQGGSGAAAAGAKVSVALQVRIETEVDATTLATLALERLRRANASLPLYLNAALDAARLGYDGVHWAERRIPGASPEARTEPARSLLRAASVHSTGALARATAAGAAFAVFGAVWAPTWKEAPERGLAALAALSRDAKIPVLAIGGVTPARVDACLRAGAAGVAVASGVLRAPDVAAAITAHVQALQAG